MLKTVDLPERDKFNSVRFAIELDRGRWREYQRCASTMPEAKVIVTPESVTFVLAFFKRSLVI